MSDGWKPIETAPTDGTPFQACVRVETEGEPTRREWFPRVRRSCPNCPYEFKHSHGWFELDMLPWIEKRTPTHWMETPTLPGVGE